MTKEQLEAMRGQLNILGITNAKTARRLLAEREQLLRALQLVLPMAKGYAVEHSVGSNREFCEQAKSAIAFAESEDV